LLMGGEDGGGGCNDNPFLNPSADNTWVLLSEESNKVRHVRIENAFAYNGTHKSSTLYFMTGYEPGKNGGSSNPVDTIAGDGKMIIRIYQNGHQTNGGFVYANYNAETGYGTADDTGTGTSLFSAFTSTPSEVCFDISGDATPRFTFWATGVNGANCQNWASLTNATKIFGKSNWTASVGIRSPGNTSVYFRTAITSRLTSSKLVYSHSLIILILLV